MTGPARIEYAIGLHFAEGTDTSAYEFVMALPDTTPEKHEMFAHLLVLAARKEWAAADMMRDLERRREQREQRAAARRRKETNHA